MKLPPLYKGDREWTVDVSGNVVTSVVKQMGGEDETSFSVICDEQEDGTSAEKQALITAAIMHTEHLRDGWKLGRTINSIFPIKNIDDLLINLPHIYSGMSGVEREALYVSLMEVLDT